MPVKYDDETNVDHFLMALLACTGCPVDQPEGCPDSRWRSLLREAGRSLPGFTKAVNEMVRQSYGKNKRMGFSVLQD